MKTEIRPTPKRLPLPIICESYDKTCHEMSIRSAQTCHNGGMFIVAGQEVFLEPAEGSCPILTQRN